MQVLTAQNKPSGHLLAKV